MGHYSAPTQKPQYAYCNSSVALELHQGPWKRKHEELVEEESEPVARTCRTYTDKSGKRRYCGTPQLKASESFSCISSKKGLTLESKSLQGVWCCPLDLAAKGVSHALCPEACGPVLGLGHVSQGSSALSRPCAARAPVLPVSARGL